MHRFSQLSSPGLLHFPRITHCTHTCNPIAPSPKQRRWIFVAPYSPAITISDPSECWLSEAGAGRPANLVKVGHIDLREGKNTHTGSSSSFFQALSLAWVTHTCVTTRRAVPPAHARTRMVPSPLPRVFTKREAYTRPCPRSLLGPSIFASFPGGSIGAGYVGTLRIC